MENSLSSSLPSIPVKRYFTIGEVSELCGVKPHVLRYWEQEFTQLRPMKRRGNRRYYQHHEVLMIRRIRDLLYDQGFTISGARNKLQDIAPGQQLDRMTYANALYGVEVSELSDSAFDDFEDEAFQELTDSTQPLALAASEAKAVPNATPNNIPSTTPNAVRTDLWSLRLELREIRALLG
jgi:DNA-binding transcriptional MerR regulator